MERRSVRHRDLIMYTMVGFWGMEHTQNGKRGSVM